MGYRVGNNIIFTSEEAPDSIKTLHRAKIFLLLHQFEPTTAHHLKEFGYSLKAVRRVFRSLIHHKIISENYHLYSLTKKGQKIIEQIRKLPEVRDWIDQYNEIFNKIRPRISKIERKND